MTSRDLKGMLQQEFEMIKRSNPNFSLRGFAKKLGITPSALSEVMNGDRLAGERLKNKIMNGLGKVQSLDLKEINDFDFSVISILIDPKNITIARNKILIFHKDLTQLSPSESENGYSLNINLTPPHSPSSPS